MPFEKHTSISESKSVAITLSSLVSVAAFFLMLLTQSEVTAASFVSLGSLDPSPFSESQIYGISSDGAVAVGNSDSTLGSSEAFRWTSGGGMVGLGDLAGGSFFSIAYDVSDDGTTVVGRGTSASGAEAFVWTSGSGMTGLGDLPGGVFSSTAYGLSGDGSVVVGNSHSTLGFEAFRWTSGGGMVAMGNLGGSFGSTAYNASSDGSVIVGRASSPTGTQAFRWTSGGGMVGLGGLAGGNGTGQAFDVSPDGTVVVGDANNSSGNSEAFRWTSGGGMVGLGELAGGSDGSFAYAVSDDGSTVVGYSYTDVGDEAFIWDATNGMRNIKTILENEGIDLTGWTLSRAEAIGTNNQLVAGYGFDPTGAYQGWVAVIPEPSTYVLIFSGVVISFVIVLRLRQRSKSEV